MPNPTDTKIELACDCGKLRGHALNISPRTGNHIICMCKDCQAFARFLERQDTILNANGGTEIFQITPSQIKLETGLEHLSAMRLSPKGTIRWYASCCNTPIANTTPSSAIPFAGVFSNFIKTRDGQSKERALGPVKTQFFARDGYGNIPPEAQHKITPGHILKTLAGLIRDKIKGKNKPSPFFNPDKSMVTEPTILSKDQRDQFTPGLGETSTA